MNFRRRWAFWSRPIDALTRLSGCEVVTIASPCNHEFPLKNLGGDASFDVWVPPVDVVTQVAYIPVLALARMGILTWFKKSRMQRE